MEKHYNVSIFVIFFITLIISIVHIVRWKLDNNKAEDEIINTQENVTIVEKEDTQNTEMGKTLTGNITILGATKSE